MTKADRPHRPPPTRPTTRIVVPEFLPAEHLALLAERAEVVYDPDLYADRPRLLREMSGARAVLVRNRTRIDAEFLTASSRLAVVGRLGTGLDNIDMAEAAARGVVVIPAPGANAVAVAEYVLGAILHLQRGVFSLTDSMLAGHWPRQGHAFGHELLDKTLGLIGLGAVARQVARRASGFGMRLLAHDPYLAATDEAWKEVERVELDRLLATADIISLHLPLNDETQGLIGTDALARMRPGAILVNTARGGIVDELALVRALREGRLGGAALDVFASEPLDPAAAAAFAGVDNLLLTPHIAGNTREAVDRIARRIVGAVLEELAR